MSNHARYEEAAAPRLLIADGDAVFRNVIREAIQAGWVVDEAESLQQAITQVRREHYDWMIVADSMPNAGDGAYLARTIRSGGGANKMTHLTGSATPDHEDELLAAGMNDFIPKPCDAELLRAVADSRAWAVRDEYESQTRARSIEEHMARLNRAISRLREQEDILPNAEHKAR